MKGEMERLDLFFYFFSVKSPCEKDGKKIYRMVIKGKNEDPYGDRTVQYLNSGSRYIKPYT